MDGSLTIHEPITRQEVKQQLPPKGIRLKGFPKKKIPAGRIFYREHGLKGPWFFASGNTGRFNLDEPRGTIYLASTPRAAALERIGPDAALCGEIDISVVMNRYVSKLEYPETVRPAALTAHRAIRWRILVNELTTLYLYDTPRAWAKVFDEAGFDGLWVTLRFSSPTARGLAIFGQAGSRSWPTDGNPIPLRRMCEEIGITVMDRPHSNSLTIVQYLENT